jgi:hypothetical protein
MKPANWDYERDDNESFAMNRWIEKISESEKELKKFDNRVFLTKTCGTNSHLMMNAKCLTEALPLFGKCAREFYASGRRYFELQSLVNLPIFYALFQKPAPMMVKYLKEIRSKLSLPQLEPNFEPSPGSWGLYTPGYYILAFHFRNIPLGFEPLSVMLNDEKGVQRRVRDLEIFWAKAKLYAERAQKIALCRNETLLIYFATDDAKNLRPIASKELGEYGRVVFGLAEEDVGHMRAYWERDEVEKLEQKKAEVLKQQAEAETCSCEGPDCGTCKAGVSEAGRVPMVEQEKSEAARRRHADKALVEWWIIANAQASTLAPLSRIRPLIFIAKLPQYRGFTLLSRFSRISFHRGLDKASL